MSDTDTNVQREEGLTVDALATQLAEISENGYGAWRTGVMYRPATPSIGGSPAMPVMNTALGFDWNRGTVFLNTLRMLGADAESLAKVRKRGDSLASTHFFAQRILEKEGLTDEERVKQLKVLFERRKPVAPAPVSNS